MLKKEKIVIIADNKPMSKTLEDLLDTEYELFCFTISNHLVAKIEEVDPTLILLDVVTPCSAGFEFMSRLKECPGITHIPVIFSTDLNDEESEKKGLELGAVDVITKPLKPLIAKARIRRQIDAYIHHKNILLSGNPTFSQNPNNVVLTQITDKRLDAAITNSKLCMFEFYIKEQRTICSPVTMEIFDMPHIIENSVVAILEAEVVHPCYVDKFKRAYQNISEGSPIEQLELIQFRKDGSEMLVELTLTNIFDKQGHPFVAIGLMKDLTDRLLLTKQAYYDDLTGCRNLAKFKLDAAELIKVNSHLEYMVIKLDIDSFKLLNEIYGYELCDNILIEFSKAVEFSLDSSTDICARITADEFILLIGFENEEILAKKIKYKDDIVDTYLQKLIPDKICIRKGRYRIEEDENDFNAIFEKVNFAHRLAKKNSELVCNYDEEIKKIALKRKDIESRMEVALSNNEFQVFLQPKYRLFDERIVGAEALARWKTQHDELVFPLSFIPIFEQNGFITRLDMYMFEQCCKLIRSWIDSGITPVMISVNFSRLHLSDKTFVNKLSELSDNYSIPHDLLEVEITETAIFDNMNLLESVLDDLHNAGFTLSMDDFGTGYSSLGLLKNIPVDVIKIDKSFFDESHHNERARTVIGCVMDMARKLNAQTVAEGVETKKNVDMLKSLGCDIVQGYYYAKPMPAEDFTQKLKEMYANLTPEN